MLRRGSPAGRRGSVMPRVRRVVGSLSAVPSCSHVKDSSHPGRQAVVTTSSRNAGAASTHSHGYLGPVLRRRYGPLAVSSCRGRWSTRTRPADSRALGAPATVLACRCRPCQGVFAADLPHIARGLFSHVVHGPDEKLRRPSGRCTGGPFCRVVRVCGRCMPMVNRRPHSGVVRRRRGRDSTI